MADEVINISLQADIKQLKAALAQLPGVGDKEAAKMVNALTAQYKKAEAAAKASAKAHESAFTSAFGKVSSASAALAGQVGGPFAALVGVTNSALRPLAEVSSSLGGVAGAVVGIGGAAAAGAVGVALFVGAVRSVVDAALEARDRLDAMGLAAEVPPAARRSLEQYETASRVLGVAMDKLTVTIGGEFADDLAVIAFTLADVVDRTESWAGSIQELNDRFASLITLGIADHLFEWRDAHVEVTKATIDQIGAEQKWTDSMSEAYAALGLVIEDEQIEADAKARMTSSSLAHKKALEAEAAQRQADLDDMLRTLALIEQIDQEKEAAANADLERTLRIVEEKARLEEQYRSEQVATYGAYWVERQRQAAEATAALATFEVQLAASTIGSIGSIGDAIVSSYEQRAAEGEKLSVSEKKAALNAWNVSQGAAYAQATMAATMIGVNTVNQLTAAFVPFPVALAAGVAATTAMLGGSVAQIASARPPEFPTGRSPDHPIVAAVQRDEAIVNRRGVAALGGPRAVDALNRGEAVGHSDGPSSEGGTWTLRIDPALGRLRVTTDRRIGKRQRRR